MSEITTPKTVEELLDYWPGNIPYKGELVDPEGCMCAQGQALHLLAGVSAEALQEYEQDVADTEVAKLFGISVAHSVLLRKVNDSQPGAPSVVIRDPGQVVGDQVDAILAFWWHIDRLPPEMWRDVQRKYDLYRESAIEKFTKVADNAATAATGNTAGWRIHHSTSDAALIAGYKAGMEDPLEVSEAAAAACHEIQGAAVLRERGVPLVFLPMFGFATPEDVLKSRDIPPS